MLFLYYYLVFITSFVFMSFEIVGMRLIAPEYGNTIYTWGAVISFFLIGSTLGYWFGGRISDSNTSATKIKLTLAFAAVSLATVPIMAKVVFPLLKNLPGHLPLLLAATVLFVVPTIFLCAVIPALTKKGLDIEYNGRRIGNLHICSALGSIFGTLLTTFIIIPYASIPGVICTLTLMLVVSLIVYDWVDNKRLSVKIIPIALACVLPFITISDPVQDGARLIEKRSSPYHDLFVIDSNQYEGEKGNFRILQFSDKLIQGAIDLNNPDRLLFSYIATELEMLEQYNPDFKDVFMIGHGVGTIANKYKNSDKRFKVAEIDPEVVKVSKQYFGYQPDNVVVSDGRRLLEKEPDQKYDYILLDAFSADSIPFHLTTKEFFQIAKEKLKPNGYVISNAIGATKGDQLVNAMFRTLKEQYSFVSAYTLEPDSQDSQNIILVASALQIKSPQLSLYHEVKLEEGELITDSSPRFPNLN